VFASDNRFYKLIVYPLFKYSSVNVTHPTFSIAPELNSGTNI